jgi:hypothetical protein
MHRVRGHQERAAERGGSLLGLRAGKIGAAV